MTPRERVLEAIAHRRTDRTPAGFHANPPIWDALLEKLGTQDREEILEHLGIDMRHIAAPYYQPETGPDAEGYLTNMWGVKHLPQDATAGDPDRPRVVYPFDEHTKVDDVRAHPWPDPAKLDFSGVRKACEAYHGEYALYGAPWSPFFHEIGWTIGQDTYFIWMSTKPDVLQAITDAMVDYEVEATRRFLEAADGLIDITYFGNDFGTQRGLFVSPGMFEGFLRLPLKRYFDASHDFGCRVMKHSCGSVRAVIPWFIEDGVDILDPIQVQAAGMDLAGLVRDFGDRLAFHGGVDTQHTLPFGTIEEVRAEVRSHIELTRDQGGYILNGSQNYIEDIPVEKVLAIYEENQRVGG